VNDWRHSPERPQLPPAFTCSIAFWLTNAIVYSACSGHVSRIFGPASIACACASLLFAGLIVLTARTDSLHKHSLTLVNITYEQTRNQYVRLILALLAIVSAGSSLSLGYALHVENASESLLDNASNHILVTLVEDSSDGTFLPRALCSTKTSDGKSTNIIVDFEDGKRYACGQNLVVEGKLMRCAETSVDYCWQRGTVLVFKANRVEQSGRTGLKGWLLSFRERAIDEIGSVDDAHSLIQALSCGYRANLAGSKLYASFQETGLAHVVAVSGAHLVIVTSLMSSMLKALRIPRRISVALLVLQMVSYTLMAGMPISCLRAALMSSVGILSLFGKRRPSSLNALGVTIFFIVCSAPHVALSSSLALSALATMGIVIFSPLVQMLSEQFIGNAPGGIKQALALSLSANFLAQWYASALFKTLPIISPVANVVCAPLLPVCCSCSLVAAVCSACNVPFASILMQIAALASDALIVVVTLLAHIPYASIPASIDLVSALICASLSGAFAWVTWGMLLRKSLLALLMAIAICFSIVPWICPQADAICMLDVGQGDSFLVTSDGKSMLIDTGNQDLKLLDQLARCHIAHLDYVVITHADDDHCGSLDALQKAVDVDVIFLANGMPDCEEEKCRLLVEQAKQTGRKVIYLNVHDVFNVGKFTVNVLWPKRLSENGENADSIILELSYDADGDGQHDVDALFTGDAESDELDNVIAENNLMSIDILKVGHHGSRNAMTSEQVELLNPAVSLIGVGANNRYGHPSAETLAMLEGIGCTVLRSDIEGGVKLQVESGCAIITKL